MEKLQVKDEEIQFRSMGRICFQKKTKVYPRNAQKLERKTIYQCHSPRSRLKEAIHMVPAIGLTKHSGKFTTDL